MNGSRSETVLTRREWLVTAGAGASLTAISLDGCAPVQRPKNVILLVSDGMSLGVPQMAETFSRLVRGKGTHLTALSEQSGTTKGFFETSTLVSMVTDSAAAASAWGSGCKVVNGAINVFPDGTALTPVMETLKQKEIATALVTTARVTHATPAGFAAGGMHRAKEDEIALQYLDRVDIILGGGANHFEPEHREDGRDLVAEFRQRGYEAISTRDQLLGEGRGSRVLGLFGPDHLPFTIDENARPEPSVPTLAEMTRAALQRLSRSAGFFLMVEGARVDHAAHANDLGGLLWDQLAFDDALGVALEFQKKDRGTLVVVTTDHGNANPGVNGVGPGYTGSSQAFLTCVEQKQSFWALGKRLLAHLQEKTQLDADLARAEISQALGWEVSAGEVGELKVALDPDPVTGKRPVANRFYPLLGRIQGTRTAVGWSGIVHTSDWAMVVARGPGQERFGHLQPHTAFYDHMAWFYGFSRKNQPFTGPLPEPSADGIGSASADG